MSIRALYYITGDTQQSGFRRIGGSESFPADSLPYLNNGESIQERARVESSSSASGGGGIQTLSHVWEYQTGKYGVPVAINTMVAIGTGRAHGFSEYVLGDTENAAELADGGKMIAAADRLALLDVERFMAIPGRETVECPDAEWNPDDAAFTDAPEMSEPGDEWRKTLLAHYWKQASVRAFSEDSPTTVRVNLGEFSDDQNEDTEATIRAAKKFFATVIVPGLPKQVQNIASMAAGVNAADQCTLYTAVEFDISLNLIGEGETLRLDNPGTLGKYRLSKGELAFITEVSGGKTPEIVQKFFDRYKTIREDQELLETRVPFMADYRVWYTLYCIDRIIKEKHQFIVDAKLAEEHGNPIRDARACFLLMKQLRKLLEKDHNLNNASNRRTMVTELTEELESGLLQVMLEDMNSSDAKEFLLRKNEMLDFHRRTLYTATDSQLDDMISLAVRDAVVSPAPQFVRCYPSTPVQNEVDPRNAKLISALLPAAITPLIDAEVRNGNEKLDNKYIKELGREPDREHGENDAFYPWAMQHAETKEAVCDFLRSEIKDANKHFLLYGLSKKYLPLNELLQVTLGHLTESNSTRAAAPGERQLAIAADGAKECISGGQVDPACVSAMNRYYQTCFRDYRADIGAISEKIIKKLGGNTTEAMTLIFSEYTNDIRLTAEEASAVFDTFGGENGKFIGDPVRTSYTAMLAAQRDRVLEDPAANRRPLINWLGSMIDAAPFEIDTSEDMAALFIHATNGERMSVDEVENVFATLNKNGNYAKKENVTEAYAQMISVHQAKILENTETDKESARESMVRWVAGMAGKAPFDVDTSDSIRAAFESARTGERISRATAQQIFDKLMGNAVSVEEKVKPSFHNMIRDQLDAALAQEEKDTGVLEWIGSMIVAADGHIEYDTTDVLKKIFESSKQGERMRPSEAGSILASMGGKAENLDVVQRIYKEMLAGRRKEIVEGADPDGFAWMCEMVDRSPWKDETWLAEQHTDSVLALCEISAKTGTDIDTNSLNTLRTWLEKGELTAKGANQLQKYCNGQLEKGETTAVDMMVPLFGVVESGCEKLRSFLFDSAVKRFSDGLGKPEVDFAALVSECSGDMERSGKRLDELYNATKDETEEFLKRHFENNPDLGALGREMEKLPKNSIFYSRWQDSLGRRGLDQQEDLFNDQPNLERITALKSELLSRSGYLRPSLTAAYGLIDGFEDRLNRLKDKSEYEAVSSAGRELEDIRNRLQEAAPVRKTLCSSMRSAKYPVLDELKGRSFRHAFCSLTMQAMLTDTEREVSGKDGTEKSKGCPDWTRVLNSLFPKAELDNAVRKPYDPKNLPVLQRLLAAVDCARIMTIYGMSDAWEADLERTVHNHSDLHRYQSALARNKKMSTQYHLKFDTDGLVFDPDNKRAKEG